MAFSLADYTDLQELGKGGMGKVYLATQVSLSRKVAIKEMAANLLADANQIKRFENEAKSAAALDHDNIIRIYDFGPDRNSFYISMEYIDGPDLENLLQKRNAPKEICLMIMGQALKGLGFAHQRNIIHRDMKPGNILVSRTGRVKVVDFGLAHARGQSMHLTATDAIVGTPLYMSPEQANGSEKKDSRMDIFSTGVLMYRILSGKFPFTGDSIPSLLFSITQTQEQPVGEIAPWLPDNLAEQVSLSLVKDPEQRLPTLDPLINALQDFFFEIGVRDTTEEIRKFVGSQQPGLGDLAPRLLAYHVNQGKTHAQSGRWDKARAHFKEALRLDPQNEGLSKALADMEGMEVTVAQSRLRRKAKGVKVSKGDGGGRRALVSVMIIVLVGVVVLSGLAVLMRVAGWPPIGKREAAAVEQPTETPVAAPKPDSTPPVVAAVDTTPAPEPEPEPPKPKPKRRVKPRPKPKPRPTPAPEPAPPAQPKPGMVEVTVEPTNAQVLVDNKALPMAGGSGKQALPPGTYALKARASGYEPYVRKITVKSGASQLVAIALKPVQRGTGSLHVHSYPWAELYVNGKRRGNTPTSKPVELPEGVHTIVVKRPGFQPYEEKIEVKRGETIKKRVRLTKE